MSFDFERFKQLAERAYLTSGMSQFTLAEVVGVFYFYFQEYENCMGQPHPHIRLSQIERIIKIMPWVDRNDVGAYTADVDVECYQAMISRHFQTRYENCDYNINHFFSGRIRELRFYETCY